MKKIEYLILHCTATAEGREVTSDEIRYWHLRGNGWKQVGYTDMFHLDGRVENLVPTNNDDIKDVWEITNGVFGLNAVSRSIVYVGGMDIKGVKPKDTRTQAQKDAMAVYVLDFIAKHPHVKVAGHSSFANKACPCFDVDQWMSQIMNYEL